MFEIAQKRNIGRLKFRSIDIWQKDYLRQKRWFEGKALDWLEAKENGK